MAAPQPGQRQYGGTSLQQGGTQPVPGARRFADGDRGANTFLSALSRMPNRHPTPGTAPLSPQMAQPPAAQQHNAQGSALAQLFQAMMGGRR